MRYLAYMWPRNESESRSVFYYEIGNDNLVSRAIEYYTNGDTFLVPIDKPPPDEPIPPTKKLIDKYKGYNELGVIELREDFFQKLWKQEKKSGKLLEFLYSHQFAEAEKKN